jgi:hypothetical protein
MTQTEAEKRYAEKLQEVDQLHDLQQRLSSTKRAFEEIWGKNDLEDDSAPESNLAFQNLITSIEEDIGNIDATVEEIEEDLEYYRRHGRFADK